jgi:DNA-binding CsgD family transcriptional regulator
MTAPLTPAESRVLALVVQGKTNKEIACQFGIELSTVKAHIEHLLGKFNVNNRTELAVTALREGAA